MTDIDKLSALAAGFRGTFTVGDDGGVVYESSPDDADNDGPRVTFDQAVVDLLNSIAPALDPPIGGDAKVSCADPFGCDPAYPCFGDPAKCSKRPIGGGR